MTHILRVTLTGSVAALTLASTPAIAAPTGSSNGPATAHAKIVKPLTLESVANMEFGDITVQDAGVATMDAAGAITCTGGLTCAATGTPAEYKVTGTNNQIVYITKPNVTLTNTVNPGTPLTLVLNGHGPTQQLLPNSGSTGINFTLGGEITIAASTLEGDYNGDLAVTVDYQ
jgi:hypothetical protein